MKESQRYRLNSHRLANFTLKMKGCAVMVGKNTQLATSYFSKEDYKKLKSIAKKEGRSISEVIRNAVIKLYGLDLKKKGANYVKKD